MIQSNLSFPRSGYPNISISTSRKELGRVAAAKSAAIINVAIRTHQEARILLATGNSQLDLIEHLVAEDVDWSKVDAFHLDEYVGIEPDHPASFHYWIRTRFVEKVDPRSIHYINGRAGDPDLEARRYANLIAARRIDLAFVGIGENGHIAFNDPHVANFSDPLLVKRVALDEVSLCQQVGEGHFPDLASVPREALTVSCTGLMRADYWVCCVPELRKAAAVQAALEGPISTACPGSLIRKHPGTFVYLDTESASRLAPLRPTV